MGRFGEIDDEDDENDSQPDRSKIEPKKTKKNIVDSNMQQEAPKPKLVVNNYIDNKLSSKKE